MKATLKTTYTIKEICEGFVYNEFEGKGLFGLIRSDYRRLFRNISSNQKRYILNYFIS